MGKGDLSTPPAFPEVSGKPHPMGMLFLLGQSQPQPLQFPPSHQQLPSPAVTSRGSMPKALKFLFPAMSFTSLIPFTPGKHKNCECFPGTFLHFHMQAIKELSPPIYFTFLALNNEPYFSWRRWKHEAAIPGSVLTKGIFSWLCNKILKQNNKIWCVELPF